MTHHSVRLVLASLAFGLVAITTGCKTAASFGSSSPKQAAKSDCASDIDGNASANMPCIMKGDGTSDNIGKTYEFNCAALEMTGTLWVNGSHPFPANQSICYAAAYLGKIDPAAGGPVKIEILAAANKYPGGEAKHGITAQTWENEYNGMIGYKFVD